MTDIQKEEINIKLSEVKTLLIDINNNYSHLLDEIDKERFEPITAQLFESIEKINQWIK